MSQEMTAALITSGCIAGLVLWIPAICLTRHCVKTLFTKVNDRSARKHNVELERVATYLMSGSRHEQE